MDVPGFEERGKPGPSDFEDLKSRWVIRFAHPFGAVHSDVLRASRYVRLSPGRRFKVFRNIRAKCGLSQCHWG
jgi:hypothetical protein